MTCMRAVYKLNELLNEEFKNEAREFARQKSPSGRVKGTRASERDTEIRKNV